MKYCYRGIDGDLKPIKCKIIDKFGYPNYCLNENNQEDYKKRIIRKRKEINEFKNEYEIVK